MIYRNLRDIGTGRWLNVLFTFDKADAQNVSGDSHILAIAGALGVLPATLEAVDSGIDQRAGSLIQLPVPPAPTPDPDLADIRAAVPAWSTLTTAQKVEVVKSALRVIVKDKAGMP